MTSTSPQPGSGKFSEADLAIGPPIYNIFEAIEPDPIEAARLTLLADLSIMLERHIRAQGWTQKEAAARLGVTQPRISDLLRGKLHVFSIDSLVAMLSAAGIRVELKATPACDAA